MANAELARTYSPLESSTPPKKKMTIIIEKRQMSI